ncbi:MAG: DUF2339 domain-containing protein [Burkholderiales bacterium]
MIVLGIVVGFIVGAIALGVPGGIAGAFVGFIVMLAWRSRSQAQQAQQAARRPASTGANLPVAAPPPAGPRDDDLPTSIARRLDAIERRLAVLERAAGVTAPPPAAAPEDAAARASAAAARTRITEDAPPPAAGVPTGFARASDGTLAPVAAAVAPDAEVPAAPPAPRASVPAATVATAPNPLWAWFTGGNALTRIGVVVLFFGVAFLLRFLAEIVTIPIEAKLAGVALAGGALVALGAWLARTRPGYGLSLEGAGAGVLYLTTFTAFGLYEVLPAWPAFVLLFAIAVLTVVLAVRADSQPLAGLAIAGGFLAPLLVATSAGAPARLFGYFAVLNAAIFALAWLRAWRALNALGFMFTFVLAVFWGARYYRPEHFATVEPFLVVFFLFYVTIAVLYAKRESFTVRAPVDALLVFGVPLVAFALQASLVHDHRYGVAWSAFALALFYAALSAALFRRPEPGLALLARAFAALAAVFGTVAIPFAADPRWTSAWWAVEAAGVYWIGCRQRQPLARGFALLLQVAAAAAFVVSDVDADGRLFLNASFFGTTLIALAALATAFVADRHPEATGRYERALVPFAVLWGVAWWYGGGALELDRELPARAVGNAFLAYAAGSVALALLLQRRLRWPRLAWFGAALLPAMALVAYADWDRMRTTLSAYGWLVWPLAWVTQWCALFAADALRGRDGESAATDGRAAGVLAFAHAASAIGVVAWASWEASEWVGRAFAEGTVWMPSAAAWPAIAFVALAARAADWPHWPLNEYRDAYATSAATTVATLLGVWFVLVNAISPGGTAPLPYVPLANPLDATLVAALAALVHWARATLRVAERTLYAWFGAAVFLFVNALVFRAVHQWLDVPWRVAPLLASKPLQAALTLTWTGTALPLMLVATRRAIRPLWMVGAVLLAVVVIKLFAVDLSALSGLPRVVAFLGVGVLLLLIGYLAPLPPATRAGNGGAR